MVATFGRPVPELSMVATEITNMLYNMYNHKLTSFQHTWLALACLQLFADASHAAAGVPLANYWAFIDGTVWNLQRVDICNGFGITAPNGTPLCIYVNLANSLRPQLLHHLEMLG